MILEELGVQQALSLLAEEASSQVRDGPRGGWPCECSINFDEYMLCAITCCACSIGGLVESYGYGRD